MILRIEFEVDSDTLIDGELEWRVNQYLFKFLPSPLNTLNKISIENKILDYQQHVPKVTVEDGKISLIEFPSRDFYQEQKRMIQHLESFGAMDLGIRKIKWDVPHIHWIAESEEERVAIKSYSTKQDYPPNNRKITLGWVQDTLIFRNMVGHLVEPLSFYRIGINHYHQHSYIQAFLHFYLMLEGFFGGKNTNKKITIDSFLSAPHLNYAVTACLEIFEGKGYERHKTWFEVYYFGNGDITSDPIRKMINIFFEERGKLAHYITSNSERRRNNFEDRNYQSLAFVCMIVCRFVINKFRIDPFREKPL